MPSYVSIAPRGRALIGNVPCFCRLRDPRHEIRGIGELQLSSERLLLADRCDTAPGPVPELRSQHGPGAGGTHDRDGLAAGPAAISLVSALSNAALAFGAVLAADLAQRFGNFGLFLICQVVFVLGSLLSALAPTTLVLIGRHVLKGLGMGMLLVATLPPLVTGFPASLKITIPTAVIGLFGAVTAGPLLGGYVAQTGAWRLMFSVSAALGPSALVLALFVLPSRPA